MSALYLIDRSGRDPIPHFHLDVLLLLGCGTEFLEDRRVE
jgi:hypothetical protein